MSVFTLQMKSFLAFFFYVTSVLYRCSHSGASSVSPGHHSFLNSSCKVKHFLPLSSLFKGMTSRATGSMRVIRAPVQGLEVRVG